MKKLYEVEISFRVHVAAKDEKEAQKLIDSNLYDIFDTFNPDIEIDECDGAIFAEWSERNPIGDRGKTCKEYAAEINDNKRRLSLYLKTI